MFKFGKLIKTNSRSFRLGVVAFVLGTALGYSITDDKTPAEQLVALGERVRTVLFVKTVDSGKQG
jgi:hypothetical protein